MNRKKRPPVVHRPLTSEELHVLREVISVAPWKNTTSEEYKDCPHSYIEKRRCGLEWDYFADLIRTCGEMRTWKAPWGKVYRLRYLIIDDLAYWAMWPILNRAPASTLEPEPQV
jgi:hypothetical protein